MAISVDWGNKIVSIPKADLTLLQVSPTEILELDLNDFRLEIGQLQASDAGISYDTIINHIQPVTVGGVELARVVEIINDYTITFEDGQYAVNLKGANSNAADRVNVNQVSVRASNSAGLVTNSAIEFGEFGGGVTIDTVNGVSGTAYPTGTERRPSNNIQDANLIAESRGFTKFFIKNTIVLDTGDDVSDKILIGENASQTILTINEGAVTDNCEIRESHVVGNLDGGTIIRNCVVGGLNYVNGVVFQTMINPGTISLGGLTPAFFLNCFSGVPGTSTPIIDCNGLTDVEITSLAFRNYSGGIKLIDFNGGGNASIDFSSGQCIVDSSCTNGTLVVRGNAKVIDENGNHLGSGTHFGGLSLINECTNGKHLHDLWYSMGLNVDPTKTIEEAVWDATLADHQSVGSTGQGLNAAGGGTTPEAIADAVWDENLIGHSAPGSAGAQLSAVLTSIDTNAIAVAVESQLSDEFAAITTAAIATAIETQLSDEFAALPEASEIALAVETQLANEFAGIPTDGSIALAVETQLANEFAAIPAAVRTDMDTSSTKLASINTSVSISIPALISALNDFNPAMDTVARVTLVDTTTSNTDMRGTDGAYTGTPPTVTDIRTDMDTNSTQLAAILSNTGTDIPALISALNDFNPATDTVANVTNVANVTSNISVDSGQVANAILDADITTHTNPNSVGEFLQKKLLTFKKFIGLQK